MSRQPKVPLDQLSPFANPGQAGGKIMKPAEKVEPRHVQGCGDPNCGICMPRDGSGRGAQTGGPDRSSMGFNMSAMVAEAMQGAFLGSGGREYVVFDSRTGTVNRGQDAQPEDEASRAARAAKAEEAKLRPAVEQYFLKTKHSLRWDDVVGNEAARAALVEAIEHSVTHRDLYAHYGRRATKGVLLYGPPGCGKTMFGKAAASVLAQLHGKNDGEHVMISIKGPEIQSPYVGVTEQTIRSIFAYARAYQAVHGYPLVVFMDEADALLPSRDGSGGRRALPYEESQVASFLAEMDGMEGSGAFVILATNRPEAIDAAVLRDGRCDRKILVERPNQQAAEAILGKALSAAPLHAEHADAAVLARESAAVVFDDATAIAHLDTNLGPRSVPLRDIINGAMLVGLVERAKSIAIRRDLAAGGAPSGLCRGDLDEALGAVVRENTALDQTPAIMALVQREGVSMARIGSPKAPRYTLDAAGEVIQLQ